MAFNPIHDYKETSAPERPERHLPCQKCRNGITITPPVAGYCWACWAGWPAVTKPVLDLTKHPHYIATMERLQARAAAKAAVAELQAAAA